MTTDTVATLQCEHAVAACGEAYQKRLRSGWAVLGGIGLLDSKFWPNTTTMPAMSPVRMANCGDMLAQPAVMATRPATLPLTIVPTKIGAHH